MAKHQARQQPRKPEASAELDPGKAGDLMIDYALRFSKMGRPKKIIDWDYFNFLCGLQCTLVEIATAFDCSDDTIENKVKEKFGITFSEYFRQKRTIGHLSLRRRQFLMAQKHVAMAIFLGKNQLNQSDHQTLTGLNGAPLIPETKDVYDELAETLLKLGVVFPSKSNGGNGSKRHAGIGNKKIVS